MKKLFNHTKRPDRNWEEDVQDGYDWDEEEYTGEDDGEEYYADEEEYTGEEDGQCITSEIIGRIDRGQRSPAGENVTGT